MRELEAKPVRIRGAGYVYLSTSAAMPGFVQVASSINPPDRLAWSLESFTGVTRFETAFSVRTTDCTALMAAMQRALHQDLIPHTTDLFKISLRFARQILLNEALAFRPAEAPRKQAKSHPVLWALAAAVIAAAALLAVPHRGAAPAPVSSAPGAPPPPTYRAHGPQLRS